MYKIAINTLRLVQKEQPFDDIWGYDSCFFSEFYVAHKASVWENGKLEMLNNAEVLKGKVQIVLVVQQICVERLCKYLEKKIILFSLMEVLQYATVAGVKRC